MFALEAGEKIAETVGERDEPNTHRLGEAFDEPRDGGLVGDAFGDGAGRNSGVAGSGEGLHLGGDAHDQRHAALFELGDASDHLVLALNAGAEREGVGLLDGLAV